MIRLLLPAADDVAELVDALLTAAEACEHHAPDLAARRRALADQLGDALDHLPRPIPMPDPGEDHDTQ
ncbi:hypothetical protein VSR01_10640 [Actinacidiphila sp. DG2A-62]|uniref:hypothetical protein n=1 Tax=Actinacidiphila sp. DG2A-62 TaxID=3108821 RepID=UPI002DBBBD04|nr:hypothetical protein [Actinacidiphila sp. DG2A-62]MEC3993975.1 hypothetical protein [Actinacidiphila sp. DG2A-62]